MIDESPADTLVCLLAAFIVGARPAVHASLMGSGGPDGLARSLEMLQRAFGDTPLVLAPEFLATHLESLEGIPVTPTCEPMPRHLWSKAEGKSVAYYQLSSGTSGSAKAIAISWSALFAGLEGCEAMLGPQARTVSWMPLNHDYGFITAVKMLLSSENFVMTTAIDFLADPLQWFRQVQQHRATVIFVPPFALSYCQRRIKEKRRLTLDLSAIRHVGVGGESVRPRELAAFVDAFAPTGLSRGAVFIGYGLGEATCITHMGRPNSSPVAVVGRSCFTPGSAVDLERIEDDWRLAPIEEGQMRIASVGTPAVTLDCWLIDDDGRRIDGDAVCGEVVMTGPMLASGYLTGGKLVPLGPELRTGDVGFLKDGNLYLVDRVSNLIIRRGCNYLARELEEPVAQELGVHQGRVLVLDTDLQDPDSRVVVVVEESRGLKLEGAAERLAALELPVALDQLFVMPARGSRTSSGKKRYAWVRHQIATNQLRAVATISQRTATKPGTELARVFAELGHPHVLTTDRLVQDLGLDSVARIELGKALESALGVSLDIAKLVAVTTVADLATLLDDSTAEETLPLVDQMKTWVAESVPQLWVHVTAQEGRELEVDGRSVSDFASCNYLGLDLHPEVIDAILPALRRWGVHPSWSRAVASPAIYADLEHALAELVGAPEVVAFPTITLLHAGVLPLLVEDGALLVDIAAHTSIQDAAFLAAGRGAACHRFPHGDLAALEQLLRDTQHLPRRVIAVDGVYSMSGAPADLPALARLARTYDATLYVDDAHGLGLVGANPTPERPWGTGGGGLVQWFGLDYERDNIVYVSGLSKSFSSLGAFVTCTNAEQRMLYHASNTFVFSGPMPVASLASALAGIRVNHREGDEARDRILALTQRLVSGARELGYDVKSPLHFPIVMVKMGNLDRVIEGCQKLWEHGILITPAVFPAVPLDEGGVRFSMTALNTEAQVDRALSALADIAGTA